VGRYPNKGCDFAKRQKIRCAEAIKNLNLSCNFSSVSVSVLQCSVRTWERSRMLTLKTNLATSCKHHSYNQNFVMLTYAVWGLGRKMFTKIRFQSSSKKFWSRWLIKQYGIIVRRCLTNIHNWIYCHFSTFSEYCERSTWQFGTNVINEKFWCVSHLFTWWSL